MVEDVNVYIHLQQVLICCSGTCSDVCPVTSYCGNVTNRWRWWRLACQLPPPRLPRIQLTRLGSRMTRIGSGTAVDTIPTCPDVGRMSCFLRTLRSLQVELRHSQFMSRSRRLELDGAGFISISNLWF